MLINLTSPPDWRRLHRTLPAGLDPLRRVPVPRDLDAISDIGAAETDPTAVGMTAGGVAQIWTQAQRLYRWGMYPALTLCIRRCGEIVLDRSMGWAHGVGSAGELATPQTPFCIYSSSKAITATVIHLLDERGVLNIGDRVCDYLPEFRGDHREDITIEHVLSHRAGIPTIPRELNDLDRLDDHDFMLEAISRVPVRSRPGSQLAYHAVSGGIVLGEVVRRATGQDIRAVLSELILNPLGFRWTNYGVAPTDLPLVGACVPTGLPVFPPLSTMLTRALGLPADEVTRIGNDPRFLTGILPSANVVSTANELSRFMDLLRAGGTLDDVQILRPRTIRRAIRERSYHQVDHTLGLPIRHGAGFMLGADRLSLYGPDTDEAFGHLGFTNVMAWADPRRELAVALITSGKPIAGPHLSDLLRLARTIGDVAPKVADPLLYQS
ncbi:MAG: serine hydrolase domain-containing protein [Jatrophihabitantaceae bacterium]